ncbi:MAG: DUF805 domain-containing protein [Novosphingobium sp.]|uniref:DUF805 domain-containing protein n=1 Tax=Novosphingobium sp. TaxID=1874826 RepID=UPI0032BB667E
MLGAIKHALANLANGNGRDARQAFWFWVLFVVILRFLGGLAISIPLTAKIASAAIDAANSGAGKDPALIQAMMTELVTQDLPRMVWLGMGIAIVSMLLLCTSLIRRLHDSDLSGWLVLIPGAISAFVIARMPAQIEVATTLMKGLKPGAQLDPGAIMQAQSSMALLAWVPVVLVIWFGLRKSSEGPNRFGDAPVRF